MGARSHKYGGSGRSWMLAVGASLAFVAVLGLALVALFRDRQSDAGSSLLVYCAAGIMPPVEDLAARYKAEYGVEVRLNSDNSGGLLSSMEIHPKGDLYIPADDLFIDRARAKGLVVEAVPLARFRLIIAAKPGNPKKIGSLSDLLRDDVSFVVCNEQAGAGRMSMEFLERAGRWEEVKGKAKVFKPTVNNAASAVAASDDLDAGFLWDSTAKQYGLEVVEIPEFAEAVADIHAGVLTACRQPARALRFARYLAAPEKGAEIFRKHKYDPIPGDAWAEVPELKVFAGGVNRNAVKDTLREFEEREGCRIVEVFGGCGTLIGQIESSPVKPDTFLTCQASYMDIVQNLFLEPEDVSTTRIVLLVREDNERKVRTLEDLAKDGVSVGITRPSASALGALSVELLKEVGIWDKVKSNIRVEAPTAHELVLQLEGHDKLDVAMVYVANCQNLKRGLKAIPIDHPKARAVQNIAPARDTKYPHMVRRLIDTITSARSAERFKSSGFSWLADKKAP